MKLSSSCCVGVGTLAIAASGVGAGVFGVGVVVSSVSSSWLAPYVAGSLRRLALLGLDTRKRGKRARLLSADAQGLHPLQQPCRVSDTSSVVGRFPRGLDVPDPDRGRFPRLLTQRNELKR